MARNLCIMGDNVAGGAQVIRTSSQNLTDLRADISRQVRFDPPDFNQLTYLQFLNLTFNEWVPAQHDLAGIGNDAKIHISCEKNSFSPLQAAFLGAAVEVFLEKLSRAEAESIRKAISDAFPLLKGGGCAVCEVEATTAFGSVAELIRRSGTSTSAESRPQAFVAPTTAAAGASGSTTPRSVTKSAPLGRAKTQKSARPTTSAATGADADASAIDASSVSASRVSYSHLPATAIPSVSSAPAVPGSDDITIYCVYSGTTTQRAKAIRCSRSSPSLDSLLSTLRQKFNAELTLGHIDESGTCTEVLSSAELKAIVAMRAAFDSLTLHCWAKATVSFDDDPNSGALVPSGGRSDAGGDTSSVASSGAALKRGRPTKSSRPVSAASSRASTIAKRKVDKVTPSFANDASGIAWTKEQIEELFNAVDTDGSGYLTKNEMMDYYRANHDNMGVVDAERKFENFLDSSTEMSDGIITLEEFGVIMLKVAQW